MHLVVSSKIARSSAGLNCPGRRVIIGNEEWHDPRYALKKGSMSTMRSFSVEALERFWTVIGFGVEVLDQGLACQTVAAIDPHRVGPQIPWPTSGGKS